ncbi:MAG: replication factor C small subunit [Candidatus Thorarchaeota archaeon]|nr:replication factor C small subunit [Candidatus Thorarchaeota archaeon]
MDLWTEKYRPQTLGEIVGQDNVINSLKHFVERGRVPHCLFSGPPGTSKTTAAMAMARDLFKESFDDNFMELNASDERGIDVVRNQVKQFARSIPAGGAPFKILVLDEADHLTADAQHALRRTMEAYASSCRMILICNYSSRIIPPIQSRCAIFRFSRLEEKAISERIEYIAKREKVEIEPSGIQAILYLAEGDMRAAINLLQAAASSTKKVNEENVFAIAGRANPRIIKEILALATSGKYKETLDMMRDLLYHEGISPLDLTRQLHKELATFENSHRVEILERTAETEFRITEGANGEVQLTALMAYLSTKE